MKKIKYLVIGAGISGLTFAYQKKDEDVFVLEQNAEAGGLCRTFYKKEFVFDVAGHFFHFHDKQTEKFFCELMSGRKLLDVTKCAKVYYGGEYMAAPFQYNIHQLPIDEFLECLTGLYDASSNENTDTFKDFVRQKYGTGIADKFLIPYNEKLYACNLDSLEKDSMGTFLPKLDFDMLMSSYRGLQVRNYNDTFKYPANGCAEIINALLERIDYEKVKLNERVNRIDLKNKVVYTDSTTYQYEYLINTMPISEFVHAAGISVNISNLNYNQVLVLNLGFDKGSIDKNVHWIYFPGSEVFYRIGFYNNIIGSNRLSLYVEISYKAGQAIDVDAALQKTLTDLRRIGVIGEHKLIAIHSIIINPAYVHITSQSSNIVRQILSGCEQNNVFSIGRYARWEYSAMDDSMEQAIRLAKKI